MALGLPPPDSLRGRPMGHHWRESLQIAMPTQRLPVTMGRGWGGEGGWGIAVHGHPGPNHLGQPCLLSSLLPCLWRLGACVWRTQMLRDTHIPFPQEQGHAPASKRPSPGACSSRAETRIHAPMLPPSHFFHSPCPHESISSTSPKPGGSRGKQEAQVLLFHPELKAPPPASALGRETGAPGPEGESILEATSESNGPCVPGALSLQGTGTLRRLGQRGNARS